MMNQLPCVALSAAVLLAPAALSASTIDFRGTGKTSVVTIQTATLGSHSVHAGELKWAWIGETPDGLDPLFFSYCVDVDNYLIDPQSVTIGSTNALIVPGIAYAGGKAAWLFNTYAPTVHSSGTGVDGAALQVAIWEALSDATPDLSNGAFKLLTTGSVRLKAESYLSALFASPAGYQSASALWLNAPLGYGQDQIIAAPIPEPGTLLLFGTALTAGAVIRRRRRKAQASVERVQA